MAKHEKPVSKAKKVARGAGKAAVVTARGVRATARGTATTLNFCISPFCLHDARTARCSRKCCQ